MGRDVKTAASVILAKHEDKNEFHFHKVDREFILEAMYEYAELRVKSAMGKHVNDASALPIHSVSVAVSRCKTCGHSFTDDVCCKDCIDLKID